MEWLTQNWIWIAGLIGVVALLRFSRGQGGHGSHAGCCGGHGKQPASDKPGAAQSHHH